MNRIVVLRVFGTAAYIFFILSVFVPFLQAQWIGISIPEMRPGLIRLWSFKGTFSFLRMMNGNGIVVEEYWFADYWCRVQGKGALGVWIEPLLIFIFEAQVLTFPTVILALWKMKCSHFLLAFLLNVFILSCMCLVNEALGLYYLRKFDVGFWFTLCAAGLFFITTLLMFLSTKSLPKTLPNRSYVVG
jgi:hypothetical protein